MRLTRKARRLATHDRYRPSRVNPHPERKTATPCELLHSGAAESGQSLEEEDPVRDEENQAANNNCVLKTGDKLRHDTALNDSDAVLMEVAENAESSDNNCHWPMKVRFQKHRVPATARCVEARTFLLTSWHQPTVT